MDFDMPKPPKKEVVAQEELPREIIETIENAPFNPFTKMEVMLIVLGRKPMTDMELTSEGWEADGGIEVAVDDEKVKNLEGFLQKTGLVVEWQEPVIDEYATREYEGAPEIAMKRQKREVLVAKDEVGLKGFRDAVASQDDTALGRFFGFPDSAIEAYNGQREGIVRQDLPEHIKDSEVYPFIQFGVLSKDNWWNEIKEAELNAAAIKKSSPKLFAEYTSYIRNTVEGW